MHVTLSQLTYHFFKLKAYRHTIIACALAINIYYQNVTLLETFYTLIKKILTSLSIISPTIFIN